MNTNVKIFFSFILGAGAGVAYGILTAPRSGKNTRKKIAKDVDAARKSIEKTTSKKFDETKELIRSNADKQIEKGKKALDKIKESIPSPN